MMSFVCARQVVSFQGDLPPLCLCSVLQGYLERCVITLDYSMSVCRCLCLFQQVLLCNETGHAITMCIQNTPDRESWSPDNAKSRHAGVTNMRPISKHKHGLLLSQYLLEQYRPGDEYRTFKRNSRTQLCTSKFVTMHNCYNKRGQW